MTREPLAMMRDARRRNRRGRRLEDVAGNNLRRAFDVDLARPADRPHDDLRSFAIPVRIRRPSMR